MVNKVYLGDVCDIQGGFAFKSNEFLLEGVPVLKIANIKSNNEVIFEGKTDYITKENYDKYKNFEVTKGDILVALSGATTGKFGIYDSVENALLNQRVARIRMKGDLVLPEYIYYYMNLLESEIYRKAEGAAQPNISTAELGKMKITLLSKEEQFEIVKLLKIADSMIKKRQSQITALDELTQSVFFKMFNIELKNNMIELKNVIESLKYGTSEKATENGYPVLRIPNINNGEIDETDMKYCNLEKKAFESYKLKKGDILFVRSNGNQSYVGRCATITSKQDGYIYASYLIRAKVKSNIILSEFITFYLNTSVGRKGVLKKARTSAGQYNINTKGLGELIIPLPNIDKQSEFIALLNDIQNKKGNLKNSLKEMRELYNALLQKAFKGELFQE